MPEIRIVQCICGPQRHAIAANIYERSDDRKSIAGIAREEGVSRSWASREANSTATKVVIASMLDRHQDQLERLLVKALGAIDGAFAAMDGKRPDHRVRMIAAKRVIEMATAGRTVEAKTTEARTITWAEFEALYRSQAA